MSFCWTVCLEDFPVGNDSQHVLRSEWTLSKSKL